MPQVATPKTAPPELRKLGVQRRVLPFLRETADKDKRTVEIAFSSEAPVERYWGLEILDHGRTSVRLERIQTHGPLLVQHNPDDQVGVVESVSLDSDRVGRAVVRFGGGQRAQEIFQDVVDGIRKSVSVGYAIHAMVLESEEDGLATYRITDWEPLEISIVSIPADVAVGVGREKPSETTTTVTRTATTTMPPETITAPTPAEVSAQLSGARNEAVAAERTRVTSIRALGTKHNLQALADQAIQDGLTVEQFGSRALEEIGKPMPTPAIGLTKREIKRYSLFRAIRALANPGDKRAREEAAFEFECSQAQLKVDGRDTAQGILIPHDVLVSRRLAAKGQRDLVVGTASAGGNLVGTDIQPGSFIEVLRASNPVLADATILTGLNGNIAIPRHSAATTAYWVAESGAPTEGAPTFDQVTMSPKTAGAYLDISRKLLLQSSIDMEDFAFMDLAVQLGLEMGDVAIEGGGSNEPTGIIGTAGIGNVAGGTNGLAPTWAHICNIKKEVAKDNALMGRPKWYLNSDTVAKLEQTERASSTGYFILDQDRGNRTMAGFGYTETNLVPNDLTKGTSSGVCSAIVFGNMADLLIGMWGGLDIIVDQSTGSTTGTLRIVTFQSCDVAVRHAQSFSAMLDALTT
jgi:HK97 family phage major capsid protein